MTIVYYHATSVKYDFPSFDAIDQTIDESRACKSALGYYVSTEPLGLGGPYNYEITLEEDTPRFRWTIGEMKEFHWSLQHLSPSDQYNLWKDLRQIFGSMFGLIEIEELDGSVGEAVIVNLGEIKTFKISEK
jgi:hypothetical protein